MNPNDLVQFLKKSPEYFTKDDIIRFCEENAIEMVNFHYAAADGKLKTLNFVISSKEYLDTILSHKGCFSASRCAYYSKFFALSQTKINIVVMKNTIGA